MYIEPDDIHKDSAEGRFDTPYYELKWPLPKGKNKKVIGVMKDKWDEKIMEEFIGLRAKTYS